jgi:serine/threonine-protein kinase RIM15
MSEGSQSQSDRPPVLDVLLCEPIPIVRYQLRKDLEAIGCAVVAVAAGDELIRRATGEVKFDVIMTALKIPKLDALDIVKLLKHTSSINSDTPIIAITAYYNEAISSAMFSEVLEKPVNRRNLQLALRKFSRWNSISNEEAVSDSEMLSDAAVSDADSSFTGNTVRMRSDG